VMTMLSATCSPARNSGRAGSAATRLSESGQGAGSRAAATARHGGGGGGGPALSCRPRLAAQRPQSSTTTTRTATRTATARRRPYTLGANGPTGSSACRQYPYHCPRKTISRSPDQSYPGALGARAGDDEPAAPSAGTAWQDRRCYDRCPE